MISGPLAGMQLAQQGAEVIKVEPFGGDPTRVSGNRQGGVGEVFYNCNRNKRSLAVDARAPAGRDLVVRLCEGADVVTQNFRPGKAAKLGLGPDELLARNPSLIYATINGFGADGPFAAQKVYDFVIQAAVGMAHAQRDRDTGRPALVRNYVIDKCTAYAAAQAITAALFARERDKARRGQHLELNMLDAGLEFFWPDGMLGHTLLEPDEEFPGNLEFYDAYETLDGAISVFPIVPGFFAGLCDALGHPEWQTDERFAELFARRRNMHAFVALVRDALRGFSSADALERLHAHDVAASAVYAQGEVADHPQVRWNGSLVERDDERIGRVRVPRHAPRFEATPVPPPGDAPLLGQHSAEVLAERLGLDADEIAKLIADDVVRTA